MPMAENTKESAFFLNEIFIPRRNYRPTPVLLYKAVKLLTENKTKRLCGALVKSAEPKALSQTSSQINKPKLGACGKHN